MSSAPANPEDGPAPVPVADAAPDRTARRLSAAEVEALRRDGEAALNWGMERFRHLRPAPTAASSAPKTTAVHAAEGMAAATTLSVKPEAPHAACALSAGLPSLPERLTSAEIEDLQRDARETVDWAYAREQARRLGQPMPSTPAPSSRQ